MRKSRFVLPTLTAIFITACGGSFLAQPERATTLTGQEQVTPTGIITTTEEVTEQEVSASSIENIQVDGVTDIENQFLEAYQTGDLAVESRYALNTDDIKIKFENWSPDGQYMLLRVRTGEVLEGKLPKSLPGMGPAIVGVTDLWLANAQGMPISLLAEVVSWNAWSPDSAIIAYVHEFVENDFIVSELWVVQPDGSNRKKLSSSVHNVAWLDNNTIIFIDSDDEQLHLIDSDGQNVRPLTIEGLASENSKVVLYALSPDRKKLAFNARGDTKIRIADLADGQTKLVTEIEVPDLSRMSWSPDSKRLAFAPHCSKPQQKTACQQIYIAQPDGTIVTQIAHRPDTNVTWSPDGRWIAFQESNRVYVADTASGQFQLLYTFSPGKQNTTETIHWSPVGKQIGLNQESVNDATILSIQMTK